MNDKLWAEAYSRLSNKEQEVIARSLTADRGDIVLIPEILLRDVRVKREICDKKSWTFRCGDRTVQLRDTAGKVLDWLDKFKAAGDIASNVDPLHAGVPWAGIRFLIQGSSQARQNLQLALTEFYTIILRFLAQAAHVYEKSSLQRAFTAFWSPDDIQALENQCRELETRAEIEAQNCDRSASSEARKLLLELPMMKDLTDSISSTVTAIWKTLQEKEAGKILKWISEIPYEDHHKTIRKGRTANTGGWIFNHGQYKKWESSKRSTILWLHGIPGAGKTKHISRVIDHVTDHLSDNAIAYFYCNRYEASRRKPTHIRESFVKQLSTSPSGGAIQQALVDAYNENQRKGAASTKLSLEESESLVLALTKAYSETILILDALDETDVEDREDLMEAIDRLVYQCANLKVLISSRRDNDITRRLKLNANLSVEATDNRDDISKFVREKIEDAQQGRHRNKPISEKLRDEIVTTLLEKSEGIAANQGNSRSSTRERHPGTIGTVAEGLAGSVCCDFQKNQKIWGSMPEIADRAFQWVHFASEPISSDALVAFVSRDMADGKTKHADLDIHDVLDACCNLLDVDRHSGLCRFSHLSVQEYLEEHHYQTNRSVTGGSSHDGLAMVTIQCLLETNDIKIANETLAEASSLRYAAKF
ncbi:uncharacterized protein N7487_009857 [Penicillium crustosum]|uniref:uncharacterized protein n=1 Tax=Penicillium crustosum TaxID=36656 RepID=UPI0023939598|nr:uncharacterized protein N7487_009857 [Penicillium crustosum]KAJ5395554.1 hypothetical protein N7487_009857 [Penicillium crustosum]